MVVLESGDVAGALAHLQQYREQICDKNAFLEIKAKLLMRMEKQGEAEPIYVELVKRNPENHGHYRALGEAKRLTGEEDRLACYAEMATMYPRAQAPRRIPLGIAEGEAFKRLADK